MGSGNIVDSSILLKYALYEAKTFVAKNVGQVACILDCRATRASWFYDWDVIWLNHAYVKSSCMPQCIKTTIAAFHAATEESVTDLGARTLDSLMEVAAIKETSPLATITQGVMCVAGMYFAGKYIYSKIRA